MQLRPEQVDGFLQTNHGVLGAGWREVNSFDDLEDEDEEYEYEETVRPTRFSLIYLLYARCWDPGLMDIGRIYNTRPRGDGR